MQKDYLEIFFPNNDDLHLIGKSISDTDIMQKILQKSESVKIPKEKLKENISAVLNDIGEIFALQSENGKYYIDEIEFGLSISVEGKVSLLSMLSGGSRADSTIVIKLKKS